MQNPGRNKLFTALFATIAGTGMLCAAEVMRVETKADLNGPQTLEENTAEKSFVVSGQNAGVTSKLFPVEPTKKYKLSGKFRAAPGTAGAQLFFGFIPADGEGKNILPQSVNVLKKGTETELAAPLAKGDQIVKVKDASQWNAALTAAFIVFNVKDDCSDLPNREYMATVDKKIEKKGDVWEITLVKPAAKDYPAGTKVRQQRSGSTYMYTAASRKPTSPEWQEFSGIVLGAAQPGTPSYRWWVGTKQARVGLTLNYLSPNGKTEFKDIVVETIE